MNAAATPTPSRPARPGFLTRFRRNRSGLAALEFALLLPTMVLLYFGSYEVTEAVTANRKVTHIASTLGDLVAQSKTLTADEMDNIIDAAESIIAPYDATLLTMRVSQVWIQADNRTYVDWSVGRHIAALATGSRPTLPAGVIQANTHVIVVDITYSHRPRIGYVLTGTFNFDEQFILRPRLVPDIDYFP